MPYDANNKHRRSIRLPDYDYSTPGAYFVTICTQNSMCAFGEIVNEEMQQAPAGEMVRYWWGEIPNKYLNVEIDDTFVIMPNHIHGTIIIRNVGADRCVCPSNENVSTNKSKKPGEHIGSPLQQVIQWYKTMTTNAYIHGVKESGWPPFEGKLWQRNYYEHVIRNDRELQRVREYIMLNPIRWALDKENPINKAGI